MKLFLFSLVVLIRGQLTIDLLYSTNTDIDLLLAASSELKLTFKDKIILIGTKIEDEISIKEALHLPSVVIDLTFSLSLSTTVKEIANQFGFIHILVEKPTRNLNDWTFHSHTTIDAQFEALSSIISYLGWEKFIIVAPSNYGIGFETIKSKFLSKEVQYYFLTESDNQEVADRLVAKEIMPSGIRNIVIFNEGQGSRKIVNSLITENIYGKGVGVVLGSRSAWIGMEDGILSYTEEGIEDANSYFDYEALALKNLVEQILEVPGYEFSSKLREYLEKNTENHRIKPNFVLLNTQNGEKIKVGTIRNGNLSIHRTITYIGNSTEIPNTAVTSINISMADGITNPGYYNSLYYPLLKEGAYYALQLANTSKYLGNFEIKATHTNCGAEVYNHNFSLSCFSKLKDQLGVAFLSSGFSGVCVGSINDFRQLGIKIPIISEICATPGLSDQAIYPEFMRVTKDIRFNSNVIISLATIFKWKNINVLYENSTNGIASYKLLLEEAEISNIKILNLPEDRVIKQNYRKTDFSQYESHLKRIYNSKGTILIVFFDPPSLLYLLENLYDVGMRRGDSIFLFNLRVGFTIRLETDKTERKKFEELLFGSLSVYQSEWIGEYGKEIKEGLSGNDDIKAMYRCPSFDSMMLVINAIKSAISLGFDVSKPITMNRAMRRQRFVGCSGTVSISTNSNDRSVNVLGIYNLIYNTKNKVWEENEIGDYNLGSLQPLKFYEKIIWPDGTINTPSDLKPFYDECTFKVSEVKYSLKSLYVLYAISFFIVASSFIMTLFIWKKWRNIEIEPLKEAALMKFEDSLLMVVIFIDLLQYISMGPDLDYDIFTATISSYASIDLSYIITFKGDLYWLCIYFVFGICLIWAMFSTVILLNTGNLKIWFFAHARVITDFLIPIIGNIFFLPVVSILLSIFECNKSIGDNLSDSFLAKDCSVFCWKGSHLSFAILSGIFLMVYIPIAVYCRPYWQYHYESINIKTTPLFLMIKSVFQVIITVLHKTVRLYNQSLHGLIFLFILAGLLFIVFNKKPFNYHRCNMWIIITLLAAMWSIGISSLYWLLNYKDSIIWISFQFGGWFILGISGLFMQHKFYPSLLYSEKNLKIGLFFRFLLRNSITADDIKEKKEKIARSKDEGKEFEIDLNSGQFQ